MERSPIGLLVIAAGLVLIVIGLLLWSGGLSWFGRLPGDIRIEKPGVRVYVPLVSMLLLSILVSIVMAIFRGSR
jgi:membrane protein implicated in regulation of membrane protease activity